MESSNLHKRIALLALNIFGASPRKLLLGFMVPTTFLSMFISNTATAAMMVPILEAVLQEINPDDESQSPEKPGKTKKVSTVRPMLCMSVCMAANVGGTGTIIGTGPNLVAIGILTDTFGPHQPMTFTTWLAFAVPQVILCLIAIWLWLQLYYLPNPFKKLSDDEKAKSRNDEKKIANLLKKRLEELGSMNYYEWNVLVLFVSLVLLWFTRSPGFMNGWGDALEDLGLDVSDASAAMLITVILFALPSDKRFWSLSKDDSNSVPVPRLLDWNTVAKKLAWGIILLFGGGFALGEGCGVSGLSAYIGDLFKNLDHLPVPVLIIITTLGASGLTQVAANVASANIFLPIMVEMSASLCINPLLLILPPTMACSFTFMLPVSNPPNAITFEPARITSLDMVKVGWVMNVVTICITWFCLFTYGYPLLDLYELQPWVYYSDKFSLCHNSTST